MVNKTRKLPDWWPMVRHAIACPRTTRTFTNVARDEDGNLVEFEEMVHQHDVYRQKVEAVSKGKQRRGKIKADKRTFWRGAFIGVVT